MENDYKKNLSLLSKEDKETINQISQEALFKYFQLSALLLSESLPDSPSEIGYVVGETTDNLPQSLSSAAIILKQGKIKKVAILDPKSPVYDHGYPGPEYCLKGLMDLGVRQDKIIVISPDKPFESINTASELSIVAEYLKETGYKGNLVLIAPWFHILRSYITLLTALRQNTDKVIVNALSVPLPPYEKVVHSQGVQTGTRLEIFFQEIVKCIKYKNLIRAGEALQTHHNQHLKEPIAS